MKSNISIERHSTENNQAEKTGRWLTVASRHYICKVHFNILNPTKTSEHIQ